MFNSKIIKKSAGLRYFKKDNIKATKNVALRFIKQCYNHVDDFICDNFYNPLKRFKNNVKRVLIWIPVIWNDRNWDCAFLYKLMSFKFKQMHIDLINGVAIQEKEDMNALKEASSLCKRLADFDYEDQYYEAHEKKYGRYPKMEFKPYLDKEGKDTGMSTMVHKDRSKVKTAYQRKKERIDYAKIYYAVEQDRKNDIDRLAHLLKEYSQSWWN